MAWKGRIAQKTSDQNSGTFTLDIDFYDDENPRVMIVRRQVSVPTSATRAEILILVRGEGVRERAKATDLKTLDAKIDAGDEVAV